MPGRSFLRAVLHPASEVRPNPTGRTYGIRTYTGPDTISPYFSTLLQVKLAGDFEGYLSFGAGLAGNGGFMVTTLPGRVVIDFPHVSLPTFPGVWDITNGHQYWTAQSAFEEGHEPWLTNPAMVVHAWAASRWTRLPAIRQTGPDTFQVTVPRIDSVATVTGTRPVATGPAPIWVITSIVDTPR